MKRPPVALPCWVELSGENPELASKELQACVATLEPYSPAPLPLPWGPRWFEVQLADPSSERLLASRLAYAHRVVRPIAEGPVDLLGEAMVVQGGAGGTGRVRVASGAPAGLAGELPRVLGHAYVQGGGSIDLDTPEHDFLAIVPGPVPQAGPGGTEGALTLVIADVPRSEVEARRAKHRPFRKPVTLPPRLARATVNLARVPLGGTLLDPFCGTGALLLESGSLGYRTCGSDLDARMVQGSLRNLAAHDLEPMRLCQGSVEELPERFSDLLPFDGVVGDPPYGRSATTGGQGAASVLERTLQTLPQLLRPGSRAVLLLSDPSMLPAELPPELEREYLFAAQRVHKSLTRWLVVLRSRASPSAVRSGGSRSTRSGS